jgi:hypothetical protein
MAGIAALLGDGDAVHGIEPILARLATHDHSPNTSGQEIMLCSVPYQETDFRQARLPELEMGDPNYWCDHPNVPPKHSFEWDRCGQEPRADHRRGSFYE